jgi:hypothetical protein
MKSLVTVIAVFSFVQLSFSQGRVDGFLKGKGNLDVALGANYETNPNYYAGKNLIALERTILSANAFFAYGFTDKFDMNLSVPYVNVKYGNNTEKDIQDVALYLKYQYASIKLRNGDAGKLNLIIAGGYSSNITDYQTGGGSAIGQQAKTIDIRPVIHYQSNSGIFVTAQGGYNYKFDPVPNAVPFAMKVGLAKAKWYADVWFDGQHGIGGFDYQGNPSPPSFRELGVSYYKIGGTFYTPLGKSMGVYGGASYMLAGRNISKGVGFSLGMVFKFKVSK